MSSKEKVTKITGTIKSLCLSLQPSICEEGSILIFSVSADGSLSSNNNVMFSSSFDDKNGECCLKTAVMLLGSVCNFTKDPNDSDLPLHFLELVCLIAKVYGHNDSQVRAACQSVGLPYEQNVFMFLLAKPQNFKKNNINFNA